MIVFSIIAFDIKREDFHQMKQFPLPSATLPLQNSYFISEIASDFASYQKNQILMNRNGCINFEFKTSATKPNGERFL